MSESLGSTVKAISHLAKAASKATEAWLGHTLGGHSLQSPQNNLLIKKITASQHPRGVRGGCSPQNKTFTSNTDANPVCLGKTGVCRLGCVEFIYTSVSVRHIVRLLTHIAAT